MRKMLNEADWSVIFSYNMKGYNVEIIKNMSHPEF